MTQTQLLTLLSNDKFYKFPLNRLKISQLQTIPVTYFNGLTPSIFESYPNIMTLSTDKYNIISSMLTPQQIQSYNKIKSDFITKFKNFSEYSEDMIYGLISEPIYNQLLNQNINLMNLAKKYNPILSEAKNTKSITSFLLYDPFITNLFYNNGLLIIE